VFTWTTALPAGPGKITGNGDADGVISITAAFDGGPTPPNCTNHFTVAGSITGQFGGGGGGAVSPPQNTSPPTISGTATQGQTLTASPGTWTGNPSPTFTYQWQQCDAGGNNCLPIAGAAAQTYTLTASDVGHTIRAMVTAVGAGAASATSASTAVVAPASGGKPSDTCKTQGGAAAQGDDPTVLVVHPLVYVWPVSTNPAKVDVCVRADVAATSQGALIEADTTGSPGVTQVINLNQPYDLTKCPTVVVHDPATGIDVHVGISGTVASVCIAVPQAAVSERIDVGFTGSPTLPQVCWTLDSNPASRPCV
jgi:hypothetical protein